MRFRQARGRTPDLAVPQRGAPAGQRGVAPLRRTGLITRSGYIPELCVAVILEVGGAAMAQGAVQSGAVVPGDVLHDRPAGLGPGGPGLQIGELALERGEEALGHGVVPALALAAH